jgi:anti-anti-sigma factor
MGFTENLASFNASHAGAPVEMRSGREGEIVLLLSGELDMKASGELTPLLESAVMECPERTRLLIDIHRVTYIASMGVGLLATLLSKAERKSVSLVLLDIPPRVRSIMEVLGLLSFFTEEKSRPD